MQKALIRVIEDLMTICGTIMVSKSMTSEYCVFAVSKIFDPL